MAIRSTTDENKNYIFRCIMQQPLLRAKYKCLFSSAKCYIRLHEHVQILYFNVKPVLECANYAHYYIFYYETIDILGDGTTSWPNHVSLGDPPLFGCDGWWRVLMTNVASIVAQPKNQIRATNLSDKELICMPLYLATTCVCMWLKGSSQNE